MGGMVKMMKRSVSNFGGSEFGNMMSDTWDAVVKAHDPWAQHQRIRLGMGDLKEEVAGEIPKAMIDLADETAEGLTPEQKFRDQKMTMVGQPVLRGRQTPETSTIRTAGQTTTKPKNRKYGSSLLTGSIV